MQKKVILSPIKDLIVKDYREETFTVTTALKFCTKKKLKKVNKILPPFN